MLHKLTEYHKIQYPPLPRVVSSFTKLFCEGELWKHTKTSNIYNEILNPTRTRGGGRIDPPRDFFPPTAEKLFDGADFC